MSVVDTIRTWPASRWPWLLLGFSAIFLESIALYFQYILGLEPCVMCVYQRAAVLAIAVSVIPALINPKQTFNRLLSLTLWLCSAFWGLKIAIEHVRMQNPENFMLLMSCDVFPNFPTWMPLHQWFPSIFEPRGTCGDIDWMFAGLSMPQWMVVIFSAYLLTAIFFLLIPLVKKKSALSNS